MSKKSADITVSGLNRTITSPLSSPKHHLRWFVFFGLALELTLIVLTRYLQVRTGVSYFTEGTYFTWFSSMQLATTAVVALIISYLVWVSDPSGFRLKNTMAWLSAGVFGFYLALTEWFSLHETVAPYSGKLLESVGINVKNWYWDLLIFSVYGFIGLVVWLLIRYDLNKFEPSKFYLSLGFIALSIGVILDTAGSHVFFVVWEDSFKILGFFFLLSSFIGILMHKIHLLAKD